MAQQNLDFNIVAHTKGMEAIAQLINRVGALEAETKKLASANAGLSASTNTVIQNGTRYNNALDAQSKQLRQARQGTQQLGMQINDFATSVSTGASVSQAFNQQLGQLGYAMSMMGGTAGKVGAFLAGPWGAAVTLAVMALGPMIEKLFTSSDAADTAAKSYKTAADEARGLAGAMNAVALNQAKMARNKAWEDLARKETLLATGTRSRGAGGNTIYAPGDIFGLRGQSETVLRQEIMAGRQELLRQENLIKLAEEQTAAMGRVTGGSVRSGGGTARSGGSARPSQEMQKAAESLKRWEMLMDGQRVEAYQDYRTMMIKSAEISAKRISDIEDEMSVNSIDRAAQAAREIGYIVDATGKQIEEQVGKPLETLSQSFQSIGNAVSDAFYGMLTGAASWKDGMKSIISSIISELWRLYVVQQIVGFVTSGLKAIGLPMPTPLPGKAVGGYVGAQKPYMVGERGPELFIPGGSGTIIPNKNLGNSGSGQAVTINVDARGSSDPAAVRAQVQQGIMEAAPAIIAAAQNSTIKTLRRPRLGGAIK